MKNEKWDDVHGNTTPDDRMVAFLESPTDSYAILQLREDVDDNIPLMFANYSYLQKKEMEPEIDRYEVVYHGSISMSEDVNRQLEDLYVKFNIDHPDDFRGHSMSVSDIVALKVVGEVSFHYVDSVGFQKLENFMKSENYLKNAEMAMEDDYGMMEELGQRLGLKEATAYELVAKGHFDVVDVLGKRRVTKESFERWYASQTDYRTVEDQELDADIMASTYGLPEMARMLGVHRQTIYYIVANEDFELIKVGRYKRATKESFEKWYHNQTRYQLAEDRQERS